MTAAKRPDIELAAYAVSLGFALHGANGVSPPVFNAKGLPVDTLFFRKGNTVVWLTARGWRVAQASPVDGQYFPADSRDYYKTLRPALVDAYMRDVKATPQA